MSTSITAQQIVERMKGQPAGAFLAGDPTTTITGVATTFVPSFDILRRAATAGRNLIISRESPYWNRNPKALANDPLFREKQEFIETHKLVVYRSRPTREVDGLARSLGWERRQDTYFELPPTTLRALASDISSKLKIHAARVIGDPQTKVAKVALTSGMITTPELAKVLAEPGVDAVVIGEPVEWEASPYFQDVVASGQKKGLIVIGLQASEEPACGEMATWLESLVPEVPVAWMPAGEPFSARRWA